MVNFHEQFPIILMLLGLICGTNLLFLGMKNSVAFSELAPPLTAAEADGAELKAPVSVQLQHAG